MNKRIILAISTMALLSAASYTASAQQEYAYPHSIDMQFGYAVSPYSVKGEAKTAYGISDGGLFDIRYTGFVTPSLGMYAELGFAYTDLDEERYFGVVNRADGMNYRYDSNHAFPYMTNYSPVFKAGLAYRLDIGQFSFRPRAGVGVTGFRMDDIAYQRKNNSSGEWSSVLVEQSINQKDYLIDREDYCYNSKVPALVLSGSLQMTYTLFQHFYFSAEAGVDMIPMRYDTKTTCSVQGNTTQAVTSDRKFIPDMFSVKFGIGWNIGWNRNERYHRGVLFRL